LDILKEEEEAFSIGYLSHRFSGMKSCGKSRLICCDMKIYGTSLSICTDCCNFHNFFRGKKRKQEGKEKPQESRRL